MIVKVFFNDLRCMTVEEQSKRDFPNRIWELSSLYIIFWPLPFRVAKINQFFFLFFLTQSLMMFLKKIITYCKLFAWKKQLFRHFPRCQFILLLIWKLEVNWFLFHPGEPCAFMKFAFFVNVYRKANLT